MHCFVYLVYAYNNDEIENEDANENWGDIEIRHENVNEKDEKDEESDGFCILNYTEA